MVTFQLGYAKSGRSCCKHCLDEIEGGGVRVGVTIESGTLKKTSYYHPICLLKLPLARTCNPAQIPGFQSLRKPDQDTLIRNWTLLTEKQNGSETKKKVEVVELDSSSESESEPEVCERARSYLDKLTDREPEPVVDSPDRNSRKRSRSRRKRKEPALPAGWTGYTLEQYRTFKKFCEKLSSCTPEKLKAECELNQQSVTGNKLDLLERVADGRTLGRAPKCAECSGCLRYLPRTSEFLCLELTTCGKRIPSSQVERGEWEEM